MPKFGCKCGYIFNLTPIPSENFYWVVSDGVIDAIDEAFAKPGQVGNSEFHELLIKDETSMMICPECDRLWLRKGLNEEYQCYLPEKD